MTPCPLFHMSELGFSGLCHELYQMRHFTRPDFNVRPVLLLFSCVTLGRVLPPQASDSSLVK